MLSIDIPITCHQLRQFQYRQHQQIQMFHNRPHLPSFPPQQHPYRAHQKAASETRKAIDHYSYAINDEIGRGFSSRVYKGRDENNSDPVAVKVIDMKMVKQSIHQTLLKNEINALRQFNCKNIMKLHDVFQTQNNTYIITEYCDSGDLNNHIRKRGRLDEVEAVRILQAVVSALYEMNKKGYIHRDIKPANILIDKNTPKLADFGFAVPSHEAKLQGKSFNVGTPLYMSPQALRQQGHTEKGDVWAVGIMLFEMLFGRTPYNAQSEAALISNILHQPLHIPSSPPISDTAKDFIRRCLAVDEGKRLKVKDLVFHALITTRSATPVERVPQRQLQDISNLQMPTEPSQQKFKRSQSQGMKEQKEYKTSQLDEKRKQHEANKKKLQEQIQRSNSQQQALQPKQIQKTSAFEEPPRNKTISLEFKQNNEILFSQINFCRFLYKFSQTLAQSKLLPTEIRDKLLFLMGKNIAIKITKLTTILDKENSTTKINVFQLEDFENYRRSESHTKFSQAISEYNEKYLRHFEKILKLAQKNNFNLDALLGSFCTMDMTEAEAFYRIVQSFLKQAMIEIKLQIKSFNIQRLSQDQQLQDDLQLHAFILQGLCGYMQLSQKVLEYMTDYRTFQKVSQPELLIERKPGSITYGQFEQMIILCSS